MYKVAILAALRSKKLNGSTIGVMITASHNPEEVKYTTTTKKGTGKEINFFLGQRCQTC